MTRRRDVRAVLVAGALQLLTACASIHAPFMQAEPSRAWPDVLVAARTRVANGRFEGADSVLAEFATKYPGSPEALETAYWRALFRMDPSNPRVSLPTALASLDGYLADSRPRQHVAEATSLRRIAGQLDGLNKLAANAMTQAKDATATAVTAKAQAADAAKAADAVPSADAEIKRLKDELAKANAELDRIRKRLSQPPPRP